MASTSVTWRSAAIASTASSMARAASAEGRRRWVVRRGVAAVVRLHDHPTPTRSRCSTRGPKMCPVTGARASRGSARAPASRGPLLAGEQPGRTSSRDRRAPDPRPPPLPRRRARPTPPLPPLCSPQRAGRRPEGTSKARRPPPRNERASAARPARARRRPRAAVSGGGLQPRFGARSPPPPHGNRRPGARTAKVVSPARRLRSLEVSTCRPGEGVSNSELKLCNSAATSAASSAVASRGVEMSGSGDEGSMVPLPVAKNAGLAQGNSTARSSCGRL